MLYCKAHTKEWHWALRKISPFHLLLKRTLAAQSFAYICIHLHIFAATLSSLVGNLPTLKSSSPATKNMSRGKVDYDPSSYDATSSCRSGSEATVFQDMNLRVPHGTAKSLLVMQSLGG